MLHDLQIFQKSYTFLFWIKQVTQKFAKAHKYALATRILSVFGDLWKVGSGFRPVALREYLT